MQSNANKIIKLLLDLILDLWVFQFFLVVTYLTDEFVPLLLFMFTCVNNKSMDGQSVLLTRMMR